jgi:predicted phage terminase large subunit-like protein
LETAKTLDKKGLDKAVTNYCLARAYTSDDGFYPYLKDILGYGDLYEPFHGPMVQAVTKPTHKTFTPTEKIGLVTGHRRRYKMIQACRGSFKSSVCTFGYATWLIAKEYTETGACNIRILIGSEVLDLAKSFVRAARQIMEQEPRWLDLFGDHRGDIKGRRWTDNGLTSRFRTLSRLKEPTISTIALDAPRAGNHYDVIIADDLETERASASREQIEKCWEFYRLMHSLLEPKGEMILVSTRWHYDDIYSRILKANVEDSEEHQYCVFIMPAETDEGKLTFPTRFPRKHLDHLKKRHGSYLYSCQFLLDPVPEEDRTFKRDWIHYVPQEIWSNTRLRSFMGVDFAYTEQRRVETGEVKQADYTVIIVGVVDEYWNYYIKHAFRDRCSKLTGIRHMFNMFYDNQVLKAGLQKFDRAQVDDVIYQYGHQRGKRPRMEYIPYPGTQSKNERIKTTLQPLFEAGKIFLLPGLDWLEEELLDFPRAAYDDGLDALCNLVRVSKPPASFKEKEKLSPIQKHIKALHAGRVRYLSGRYQVNRDAWKTP